MSTTPEPDGREGTVYDPAYWAAIGEQIRAESVARDADAWDESRVRRAGADVSTQRVPVPLLASAAARLDWGQPLSPAQPIGLSSVDDALGGGMRAESVYSLSAPTGKGKSGCAIQISRYVARTRPVIYLSSELSRRQVLARVAAQGLRRSWRDLYELGPSEAEMIAEALGGLRLRVAEINKGMVMGDVLARVADEEGEAPFIVLDYLQSAARRCAPNDMRLAVSQFSDELATCARQLRVPALVVSSVARSFYFGNEDKAAGDFLGAAKESGDVEFDAAAVMFLDVEPCPVGGTSAARFHVAKSRFSSAPVTVGLRFDGAIGLFTEDPFAVLTEEQRAALQAIRSGVESVEELRAALKIGKGKATQLAKVLAAKGMIDRSPLRIREGQS